MFIHLRMVILCCIFALVVKGSSSVENVSTNNSAEQPIAGYGYEIVLSKLDYLQYKLHAMEFGLKERDEELTERIAKLEDSIESLQWAITRHDRDAAHNLTTLQANSRKILAQHTACASHEQMRKEIAQLAPKLNLSNAQLLLALQDGRRKGPFRSCKEAPFNSSGVYSIQVSENDKPFEVFCEQNSFGGGWLVIQRRFDGTLDFYRTWTEYRNGFGSVYQEYWIGLERLHNLTSQRSYELLVEMKDFTGLYKYARYDGFKIGSETEQYLLAKLGTYDGTAGDSLKHHEGAKFTTKDRDNDENGANCAAAYEGAWWYRNCHASNLNGRYMDKDDAKSMCWHAYKGNYQGLANVKMMIREI
ncbi:AGAP011197-PA-like protein [Anopheles sinensis]|uniref:AGAP011197-PA-like protein n=1 Tax=Anopheles sinensis TaxID=74873 RepID=A0A084W3L8_ANOSI|nr:AGAP011197-PA-like protein [Anopheles sinensis]